MVFVKVSETYDLSTKVNKMGLVGIHTPTGPLPVRLWGGLFKQFGKVRFASCDVSVACASMLPADPLQVGLEAGEIAPQDMFNPILYRAVSNESMSNIQAYVQARTDISNNGGAAVLGPSVNSINDPQFGQVPFDQFDLYYGLLSETSGWRKAMPQAGLEMRGLYPMVYHTLNSYGQDAVISPDNPTDQKIYGPSGPNGSSVQLRNVPFRGKSCPMPALPTTYWRYSKAYGSDSVEDGIVLKPPTATPAIPNELGKVTGDLAEPVGVVSPPPTYVGLIVLPPAKLNQLFYRMKVTWTLEFTDLRPLTDIMSWQALAAVGTISYATDYATQSASMSSKTAMVDTVDADLKKVMEGV